MLEGITDYDTVLVVDDDLTINMIHRMVVQKYMVIEDIRCFTNPLNALNELQALLLEGKQNILVLLDINMPELNGFEFLDRSCFFENIEAVDIVIVTSSIDTSDFDRAENHSLVLGCLSKPLRMEAFGKLNKLEVEKKLIDY